MRTAACLTALFVLFALMNLFWQLPVVPLPLIHEAAPLVTVDILLQPWLFILTPLLLASDQVGLPLYRFQLHGASIPMTGLFAASSTAIYYGLYRVIRHVRIFRPLVRRAAFVFATLYILLLVVYGSSCAYVVFTLTQRLKALG